MKEGDIIVFIDTDIKFNGFFTINKKYIIKEFGEMHIGDKKYFSWINVADDNGADWEMSTICFRKLDDIRAEILNNIGI